MKKKAYKKILHGFMDPIERILWGTFFIKRVFVNKNKCILIACMPKSGSTFLAKSISNLTGYPQRRLSASYERNDQDIYFPRILDSYGKGTICQQHLKATRENIFLINKFSIKTIVLVRNLLDTIVSLHDHILNESFHTPVFYANENFNGLPKETQLDQIIDLAIPWYINFYVSWW